MAAAQATTESDREERRNYYVPFQIVGGVVIRARDEDEAEELANQLLDEGAAVEVGCEDLTFNHKWGPGIEATDDPTTAIPGGPCDTEGCDVSAPHDHVDPDLGARLDLTDGRRWIGSV